jgi:hypothetical protein
MKIYWQQYMIDYLACPLLLNWTPKIFKPEICTAKRMASKLIDIAKTVNWLLMMFFQIKPWSWRRRRICIEAG